MVGVESVESDKAEGGQATGATMAEELVKAERFGASGPSRLKPTSSWAKRVIESVEGEGFGSTRPCRPEAYEQRGPRGPSYRPKPAEQLERYRKNVDKKRGPQMP